MRRTLSTIIFLFLHLLLFWPGLLSAAGNLTQNSSRECAICHFRWMDQFVAGHGTRLAPLETKDVAGEEMMCLSCHDGSTEDSRRQIWLHDRHLTDIVPSEKVKIPKVFPLSEEGKMVCATCHSAHSVPTDTSIERTIFLRVSSHDSQMCEMCHTDQGSKNFQNHPVNMGKTPLPEEIFAAGGVPSDTNANHLICESCHTAHGGLEKKNLIFAVGDSTLCSVCHPQKVDDTTLPASAQKNHPLAVAMKNTPPEGAKIFTGPGSTIQCISCHQVHQHETPAESDNTASREVNKILRFAASDSSLCIVCHADKEYKAFATENPNHPLYKKYAPKTVGDRLLFAGEGQSLQCLSCHQIHEHRPGSKSLVAGKGPLCAACHPEKQQVAGSDHDLTVTAPAVENRAGQSVNQSGLCGPCHIPHNGDGKYLWARKNKQNEKSLSSYCLDCHSKDGPAKKKMVGVHTHPVSVAVEGSPPLPLFQTPKGKDLMECSTCHDPHRWSSSHKGPGQGKNREGDGANSFLRKPSGQDSGLCKSCHITKYRLEGTDHDLRVTAPKETNINNLTVVQSGLCGGCHVVHNATGQFLWGRPAGEEVSSPSDLCRSCHGKKRIAAEKQVGAYSHPVEVAVDVELGKTVLPLNRKKDGQAVIECHTCHDPHQWNSQIKSKGRAVNEEGDEDSSFLRMANREKPLLCKQCHEEQTYIAGSDHDMRVTAPGSKNVKTQLPKDGSVCAPCHAIHNSNTERALWNAPLTKQGQDFMEQACYGCHQEKRAGKEKVVTSGSHPTQLYFGYKKSYKGILSTVRAQSDPIPLYSKAGLKADTGEISCPTCHDPHIWSGREKKTGPGTNSEGTLVDSFLRQGARSELCYACHGKKTLMLYRFYHQRAEKKGILHDHLLNKEP
ncbi:MAG: putative CXXCH cytochrome family protein [Desulforhopalus sp.]|jgi:predicted CXXCH cytochrome family protein